MIVRDYIQTLSALLSLCLLKSGEHKKIPKAHKGTGTLLVVQLVEALRYKSEVRGFNSRWCHSIFSLT
jgi:hypothetical protein